jgi:hypothetical protein
VNASQKLQCGDHAETPAVSLTVTKEELPVRQRDQAVLNVTENIRVEDWFESQSSGSMQSRRDSKPNGVKVAYGVGGRRYDCWRKIPITLIDLPRQFSKSEIVAISHGGTRIYETSGEFLQPFHDLL